MRQPLLIADSGGTKTDWCYVDENNKKHFFSTESYHPTNWSAEFIECINAYWTQFPNYKSAELHFFCAGCLKLEKANELKMIFHKIGFSNVNVKSDLHAAGLALYGNKDGNVAIIGTGSVFFEWKNADVASIIGGKGFEIGDEGSGFYFGKLIFQAYQENKLTLEQRQIFEENIDVESLQNALKQNQTKTAFSKIPKQLKQYIPEFTNWHEQNIRLFFEPIQKGNTPFFVRVVGGYFTAHSSILISYLSNRNIVIDRFTARPIDSLVDYFVYSTE